MTTKPSDPPSPPEPGGKRLADTLDRLAKLTAETRALAIEIRDLLGKPSPPSPSSPRDAVRRAVAHPDIQHRR